MVWLHYRSNTWASRAIKRFTSKFHGRQVKTKLKPPPSSHGLSKVIWSVQLSNVPAQITEEEVHAHLQGVKPDMIVLGQPTSENALTGQDAVKFVKDLFSQSGRKLCSFELESNATGSRTKAFARFDRVSDARSVLAYNGADFRELGSKFFADQLAAVKIPISRDIYAVMKERLDQLQAKNKEGVRISTHYQPQHKIVNLRVYGLNAPAVTGLKVQIGHLLSGAVLQNDIGKRLWHSFFGTDDGASAIQSLSEAGKVFLYGDARKQQVVFFGLKNDYEKIRRAVVDILISHRASCEIPLDYDLLGKALSGGFRRIVRTFGKKNAKLNIQCQPPVVLFKGSPEQFDAARALLDATPPNLGPSEECPCCLTEIENPAELRCGHVYCRDCFETLCRDFSSSGDPITCFADDSTCGDVVSLDELGKLLSGDTLESVLENSFEQHIRSKADEIQYCPTPDCPSIYQVSKTPAVFTCSNCLISICSKCRLLSHDDLSCEDAAHKGKVEDEVSEEHRKKLGLKYCPKCNSLIQKGPGCNHVACTCDIHICWSCLKTFTIESDCYDHMTEAHGRFGDLNAEEEQLWELERERFNAEQEQMRAIQMRAIQREVRNMELDENEDMRMARVEIIADIGAVVVDVNRVWNVDFGDLDVRVVDNGGGR